VVRAIQVPMSSYGNDGPWMGSASLPMGFSFLFLFDLQRQAKQPPLLVTINGDL
jgi:hypothetical protein